MDALAGQVALVTGAAGGMGQAISLGLTQRGATVLAVGRRAEALEELAEQAAQRRIIPHPADLTDDDQLEGIADRLHQLGGLDILVHSAAVISMGSFAESSVEELDQQYRTNVRAPFLLTQLLLPMLKDRRGQVVFINSTAGLTAIGNLATYAASKHALRALADSLRDEVNSAGVRVVSIFPGRTATPMQAAIFAEEQREYRPERLIQPQDVAEVVLQTLLLPRTVEVTTVQMRPFLKS